MVCGTAHAAQMLGARGPLTPKQDVPTLRIPHPLKAAHAGAADRGRDSRSCTHRHQRSRHCRLHAAVSARTQSAGEEAPLTEEEEREGGEREGERGRRGHGGEAARKRSAHRARGHDAEGGSGAGTKAGRANPSDIVSKERREEEEKKLRSVRTCLYTQNQGYDVRRYEGTRKPHTTFVEKYTN